MVARSLFDFLTICATRYADREAFVFGETRWSYKQFHDMVNQLAHSLARLNLQPGDRIALMLPNLPQFPIAYYALLKIGAVVVPVNIMFREQELHYVLQDSGARGFIAWSGFSHHLMAAAQTLEECRHRIFLHYPADTSPPGPLPPDTLNFDELTAEAAPVQDLPCVTTGEDPAVILYTAGTTGLPRGAVLTHAGIAAAVLSCWDAFRIDANHRFAAALPLFHGIGQMLTMNVPLAAGACCVLIPRFDPLQVLQTIARERVTHFVAVPAMLHHLLTEMKAIEESAATAGKAAPAGGISLATLQALIVTGMPVDDNLRQALLQRFGVAIFEGYGLAECSPLVSANRPDITNKHGSVGKQLPGLEVSIVDEKGQELPPGEIGEIVVRGAAVMKGYHNRPEETASVLRDGWLHTGDIGRTDESGYLYLVDRKSDVIRYAGFPIFPLEVERCLLAHPQVVECAVIGLPNGTLGQEARAYVVLRRPHAASAEELIQFCRTHLPAYMCPRTIEFCAELPHGPTGKILKHLLRERLTPAQHQVA
ncbi:MAG: long-chain fatty acid--CoA ligase [candidate division KSB1 bacterium]|nr:long-chain fatty acid--CoA ligase [candidate division KSB1 bacterium]MDZ7275372.1 long-chain fatty acid--CoA ligase [candidate division KSB1 bacterium]MDZ7286315.1 long-chain fatty acid--CoA ligase [candidate division KSB1 bacterium]MDZ7296542.1 long-chain fatty acid--CoA ligase [candidate division KSB1 bacterium]MDZ7308105.1 long-chain fatty acid--CoA ligase [candidate division KSB1 bacterium]